MSATDLELGARGLGVRAEGLSLRNLGLLRDGVIHVSNGKQRGLPLHQKGHQVGCERARVRLKPKL